MKLNIFSASILILIITISTGCSDGSAFELTKDEQFKSFVWYDTTCYPAKEADRSGFAGVLYNDCIYVVGGLIANSTGSIYYRLNDVQYTHINNDGSLNSWTETTSFITARYNHRVVAYNGFLYVIGGNTGDYVNDVQYAPINADGSIGTWTATTSFTTARAEHECVVYNGYLYILGGHNNSHLNDVQYAPINADGSIGTWTTTTPFPTARSYFQSFTHNNYIYVMGGHDGDNTLNDIQYAPINADGSIGTWTATTSFPTQRSYFQTVVYEGILYSVGGIVFGGGYVGYVQYAAINSNGTIGNWTGTQLKTSFSHIICMIYHDYLYVITRNSVKCAKISK